PQVHFVDNDVFRVARIARPRRAEKAEQRALRPEHTREMVGQLLGRPTIEVVDEVPAQDAVDGPVGLREPRLQEFGKRVELPVADVSIEIREDVLDENLAPELLAKERDVAADDRAEIEQDGQFARRETRQEFSE